MWVAGVADDCRLNSSGVPLAGRGHAETLELQIAVPSLRGKLVRQIVTLVQSIAFLLGLFESGCVLVMIEPVCEKRLATETFVLASDAARPSQTLVLIQTVCDDMLDVLPAVHKRCLSVVSVSQS